MGHLLIEGSTSTHQLGHLLFQGQVGQGRPAARGLLALHEHLVRDVEKDHQDAGLPQGLPHGGGDHCPAAQIELFTGEFPEEEELRRYLAGVKHTPETEENGTAQSDG